LNTIEIATEQLPETHGPGPEDPIADLRAELEKYLDQAQIDEIHRAYRFGAEAHTGQLRLTGEPYISHPLAAAKILAEMRLDDKTIIAAILHDVIEDTDVTKPQLEQEFGSEVAELVDGVSKLTQVQFESRAEAQAENFQKMMLAMVRDLRVILVKLADRIHNMRTLGAMRPEKRRRIARETLDIYTPIAHRLGINTFRLELEELGFAALYPMRYRVLQETVKKARGNRKEIVHKIGETIKNRLEQENLHGWVVGREKHLYSLYRKMRNKELSFSDVFDVYAFRIIVDSVDACYRTLGVVHGLYKPVPGKFKDYVAIPKSNGYQSLHTVLFGPYGVPIEVQIRTEDMDRVAEAGIAAHWLYKTGDKAGTGPTPRTREWLRGLLELQKNAGDSMEFIENVKIDLFPDVVYVFTPKGEIKELPRGSTAVDFAYAVHSDVGNTCVAVKIDRHLAPLSTPLYNGQTVEVITAPSARPNPVWLNFVVTGKARTNIRHYLKNLELTEAVTLGRRLLEQALTPFSLSIDELPPECVEAVLNEFRMPTFDALLSDIGLGNRMALLVARRFSEVVKLEQRALPRHARGRSSGSIKNVLTRYVPSWLKSDKDERRPLAIKGTEGMVVNYARCCRPIPGDSIVGFVSAGRGIVIHEESCKNVAEFRRMPEKWIAVQWERDVSGEFPVDIRVDVRNQRGALATVASAIADMEANIENVDIEDRDGTISTIKFTVDVHDRKHLANVMRRIRTIDLVVRISRNKN
jgi:RelA/SpoT family (p)ppGpp synthetase